MNVPAISAFLQAYMSKLLGIFLIITGMVLLELLPIKIPGINISERFQQRFRKAGYIKTMVLGMIFALTFCPISAALYFGGLIPIAVKLKSAIIIPGLYGIGSGLPAAVFAIILALAAQKVGAYFSRLQRMQWYAAKVTGIIFILIGIYYVLAYIFEII